MTRSTIGVFAVLAALVTGVPAVGAGQLDPVLLAVVTVLVVGLIVTVLLQLGPPTEWGK